MGYYILLHAYLKVISYLMATYVGKLLQQTLLGCGIWWGMEVRARVRGNPGSLILSFDYVGLGIFEILEKVNAFNSSERLGYMMDRSYRSLLGRNILLFFIKNNLKIICLWKGTAKTQFWSREFLHNCVKSFLPSEWSSISADGSMCKKQNMGHLQGLSWLSGLLLILAQVKFPGLWDQVLCPEPA